jgi:hypothetical protein
MIDSVDKRFGTCESCGHPIREADDGSGKYEHFTRVYKTWGYPYTTKECHADNCNCEVVQV